MGVGAWATLTMVGIAQAVCVVVVTTRLIRFTGRFA
jgi:hypothetical protein